MEDEKDVSRRDFFKTVGVGSIATAVVAGVRDAEAQGPAPVGPGDVPITLTINGQRHQLSVEPRVTLLDAMRTRLEITGQKRVCDRGACGACTVIIDGRTYYSCSMLAIEAQGKNIRTVDGLANGNDAASGAAGVLRQRRLDVRLLHAGLRDGDGRAAREESESDARAGEEGARRQSLPMRHQHRRTESGAVGQRGEPWITQTHRAGRLNSDPQVPEVQAPPRPPQHDKYPWPEKSRLLGTRVSRIDGPLKASGRAKYSYDIVRPGMIYGRILRSPHAHARLKSIDAAAAEKAPGVKALLITIKPGDKVMFPG